MKFTVPLPILCATFTGLCCCSRNTEPGGEPASKPEVVIATAEGNPLHVAVEVADTPAERATGLMYREHLDPNAGMIFLFPAEQVQTFWMKNTVLSLDMIFISRDLEIVGIVEAAEPQTTTTRSVVSPSQYVLEVSAFWTRDHHVMPGQHVEFHGFSTTDVE